MTPEIYNKQFITASLARGDCEYLAYLGQPMLYDGSLYVVRHDHKDFTPTQYYMWVKGIRVA